MTKSWSRAFHYVKGRPSITVQLSAPKGRPRYFELLIDSGADYTVISKSDAAILGIDYDSLKTTEKQVEAANLSYIHTKETKLQLKIDEIELVVPVLVSKEDSEALLGRKGIFSVFDILFEERNNQVIFTKM